jgi:putative pyruvate formate lyase activating enzyme
VPEYAYEKLVDYAISLGTMQAFIQEGDTAKESFIPPFTLEGV